jgi:L-threonine kinase
MESGMKEILPVQPISTQITKVPCTCGEFFQGIVDGEPCLISCPIDLYCTAQLCSDSEPENTIHKPKITKTLQVVEQRTGIRVNIKSDCPLPAGRGYGTSTADIGAVLYSINQCYHLGWSAEEIAGIAVQIEPTDSTLFPGLTCFQHQTGNKYEWLGNAPQAQVIILDPGGIVDSQEYNKTDWYQAHPQLISEHQKIFQMIKKGIAESDLALIAQAATMSAKAHQVIAFNPLLDQALSLANSLGAFGVCRAHSGTILGILFPPESISDAITNHIKSSLHGQCSVRLANLTQGGPVYQTENNKVMV